MKTTLLLTQAIKGLNSDYWVNLQDGPGQGPTMALRQRESTAPSAVVALVNLQSPDCRGEMRALRIWI